MDPNSPTLALQDLPVTGGYALKGSNNDLLSNISASKLRFASDTSISSNNVTSADSLSRNVHIPYILNGELFEIQTQDGENVTVKCCNCPPDRVYRGSVRSTGNFHMHIKRRHPDLMGKIYDMKVNALVERRDRFLRNRKATRRRNSNAIGSKGSASRSGQRLAFSTQAPSELFKIKAAFQRHQLQKQQQNQILQNDQNQKPLKTEETPDIIHKWNMIDHFLATPALERAHNITLMDTFKQQPLNYSLKQANEDTVGSTNYTERAQEEVNTAANSYANKMPVTTVATGQITEYELLSSQNNNNNQTMNCILTKQRSLSELSPLALTQNDKHVALYPSNSDQSLFGRATTLSAITPCPSEETSYDTNQDANGRAYDFNCNNLGIIKNELLLAEIQPIDLSAHPSSSGLSGSSGFGSTLDAKQMSSPDTYTLSAAGGNIKCDDVLLQVANALQNLHRELQCHNRTNRHWLSLEIAKFKFLHPEFQFLYQA